MTLRSPDQNRHYLREEQYRDARNLEARIELHRRFSVNAYGWSRWLFDRIAAEVAGRPRVDVLELGCGPATLWRGNLTRLPQGWSLLLSDFSEGMLREARAALGERGRYAVADAQAVPFANETFDLVLANHMLYHVPDRPRALREIARVLRPAGKLIASTVGDRHLAEIDVFLRSLGVKESDLGRASSAAFTLQNGALQIRAFFAGVRALNYDDALRVTDPGALLAYARSMRAGMSLSASSESRLRTALEAEIAARGCVAITKESGVFVADRR